MPSSPSELPPAHTHTCATCQHQWSCPNGKCPVEKAAKANGQGPFCHLCFHLEFATRYAFVRGWLLQVTWLEKPEGLTYTQYQNGEIGAGDGGAEGSGAEASGSAGAVPDASSS